MRTIECTPALRNFMSNDQLLRYLGANLGAVRATNEQGIWPLLKLSLEIKNIQSFIPSTILGIPVVRSDFYPYQQRQ